MINDNRLVCGSSCTACNYAWSACRGVDVITAFEDGAARFEDPDLLDRAIKLRRVLFTQDEDFLEESAKRLESGVEFFGVIFARQMDVTVGACIRDLEYIAKVGEMEDMINQIYFLPLSHT